MSDTDAPPMVRGRFYTGATPSPRYKLLAATPHRVLGTPPPRFAMVPKEMRMWGNDQVGDCVSAEEAFAKAAWSIACGLPELCPTDDEVLRFASRHGFANGAALTDVMDTMKSAGMAIGGATYKDGGYSSVDYSDESVLQSAISTGPVKIAIDHSALPDGAGDASGWHGLGGRGQYGNSDHCVGLSAYGTAGWLYQQLGVPIPSGLPATTSGYLLFTWSTLGFVDHPWLMSTCSEAWVRIPTTPGETPEPSPGPPPPPGPDPSPSPSVWTGMFSVSIDATTRIATLTPPAGFRGQVAVDPPPYRA